MSKNKKSKNCPIPENYRLRAAERIIKNLYGSKAEMRGQFEMIVQTEEFNKKYPGVVGKDIRTIVNSWLTTKNGLGSTSILSAV